MVRFAGLLLLLLVAAPPCLAGGFGWGVTVQRMEFKPDGEFLLRVVPEPEALNFPRDCSALTVAGSYASFRWFLFGDKEMTFENHMAALRFLSSHSDGRTVFFGQIGDGLAMDGDGKCSASSRGLTLIREGEVTGVYSYYKWP
jgi:hypothetical protein